MYRITLQYDNAVSTVLDGFGPSTVVGIVKDAVEGHYSPEIDPELVRLTIEAVHFEQAEVSDNPPED